jgi:hypothetical protein
MTVRYTPRDVQEFDNLPADRQQAVVEAIQAFTDCITNKKPVLPGLGLSPFHGSQSKYWEFRSTLADRILCNWETGGVVLRCVGSHDDLRRFAKGN